MTATKDPTKIKEQLKTKIESAVSLREQKEQKRREENQEQYERLIAEIVSGIEKDPNQTISNLEKWGIPVEEFQKTVELRLDRADAIKTAATLDQHVATLSDVKAKKAEAERLRVETIRIATEKANAAHAATIAKLDPVERLALEGKDAANTAIRFLLDTAPKTFSEQLEVFEDAIKAAKADYENAKRKGPRSPTFPEIEQHRKASERLRYSANEPGYWPANDQKIVEEFLAIEHASHDKTHLEPYQRAIDQAIAARDQYLAEVERRSITVVA